MSEQQIKAMREKLSKIEAELAECHKILKGEKP